MNMIPGDPTGGNSNGEGPQPRRNIGRGRRWAHTTPTPNPAEGSHLAEHQLYDGDVVKDPRLQKPPVPRWYVVAALLFAVGAAVALVVGIWVNR